MIELEKYQRWLNRQDWSANTKRIYYAIIRDYAHQHSTVDAEVLHRWKSEQYKRYKPAGTNLRIRAMNVYLEFTHSRLRLKCVLLKIKSTVPEAAVECPAYRWSIQFRVKAP